MQIILKNSPQYQKRIASLRRSFEPDAKVRKSVERILADVRGSGDRALLRLTKKFGGPKLTASELYVTPAELAAASATVAPKTNKAIEAARRNVLAFARKGLRKSWFRKNAQGGIVGERFDPFQRVGIYIPGGTAPLVSTAVMTCTLAAAAGVPEIVAVTPCGADGKIHPALLAALSACGATEVYRVGGAQAVAALAYGTKTIRPVQKIFGPGNAFVVEAKRQVFGKVAIDLLPGPSEVLVIADAGANPEWVAADLLAQCEHGHGSAGVLLTPSRGLINKVSKSLTKQITKSSRGKFLAMALENTALVEVGDIGDAVRLANDYAAEHVSIAAADPGQIALGLTTAGAIFLGGLSPVAVGDFLAGPSHELPTGGGGKSFPGLTADQFQRRTSILLFDESVLRASLPLVETFSEIEGLDAHARSVALRLKS
ncbi:MAG: histidinol dehydrogenase [Terrimicrobiaceae bacterium]